MVSVSHKSELHPAMQYIDDVLAGKIPVCRHVMHAVKRHQRDLETGHERGIYFDADAAAHAIDFFQFLHHSKGEWAGQVIALEPWQQFILWCVFGWKRADGMRRFRTVYEEVARKNGKSTKLAGIGNYLFVADNEPGAEVYSAATKRDQAKIIHQEAMRMVNKSPSLRKRVQVYKHTMAIEATSSKFEPLGADDDTLDGLNVHGAIIDEVHAHKTRGVFDVLETATGSRRQPLLWVITTAGVNRHSICWELRDYTAKVLDGTIEDDSWFGIIYSIEFEHRDPKHNDRWDDEQVWLKANPNLGISTKLDDLRRKAAKAKEVPTALNNFLRKHLNVWTEQDVLWINMEKFRLGGGSLPDLRGRECIGALDLSIRNDLSAFGRMYPLGDGRYAFRCNFWMPGENIKLREKRDRVPYATWAKQGLIKLTDGDTIDYDVIRHDIGEMATDCLLREIAFDPYNATQLCTQLQQDGFDLVEHRQGFLSMSPPSKALEELVTGGKLLHGDNPVVTWMFGNAVVEMDAAGNIKPTKNPKKARGRIDAVVTAVMTLGRWIALGDDSGESVYEERGLLTI